MAARTAMRVRATSSGAKLSRPWASRTWKWMAPAPAVTASAAAMASAAGVTGSAGWTPGARDPLRHALINTGKRDVLAPTAGLGKRDQVVAALGRTKLQGRQVPLPPEPGLDLPRSATSTTRMTTRATIRITCTFMRTSRLVWPHRSEEHTSELQSRPHLVCRLLLEKKKKK